MNEQIARWRIQAKAYEDAGLTTLANVYYNMADSWEERNERI